MYGGDGFRRRRSAIDCLHWPKLFLLWNPDTQGFVGMNTGSSPVPAQLSGSVSFLRRY